MATDIDEKKPVDTTDDSGEDQNQNTGSEDGNTDTGQDGDDDYTWDFGDEVETGSPETDAGKKTEASTQAQTQEKQWWETAAEKTGIKASSEEEYVAAINSKSKGEVFVDTNDPEISRMTGYLNQDDEGLVRAALEAEGWSEEKIEKRIAQETESGQIEFTAEGIRGTLRKAVKTRQQQLQSEFDKQRTEEATLYQTASNNAIKAIAETDKLFGFKVAKDEKGVQSWREKISKDIQSGQTLKAIDEIIKDARDGKPERLIELAQWLRSSDGIVRGLVQRGKSEKSDEILNELRNTSGSDKDNPAGAGDTKKFAENWFTDPKFKKK